MNPEPFTVKVGSVSLTVNPWRHPSGRQYWRWIWTDSDGKQRAGTRSTKEKAKAAARETAVRIANALPDLSKLEPEVMQRLALLLRHDPRLSLADDYLGTLKIERPTTPVEEAAAAFLALKEANRGRSSRNVDGLTSDLRPFREAFGKRPLSSLTVAELEAYLHRDPKHSPRTRKHHRGSLVTFFRWAARAGHLPKGETAMELTASPIIPRQIPSTWTADELETMLAAVDPDYLPWLACAAFGGFRTDELCPSSPDKSPLDWSDFQWEFANVRVRPETDKNGRARNVPILPALQSYLEPLKQAKGRICPKTGPWKGTKTSPAQTKRLGDLVGGWKRNALRHSWISYRSAEVGLAITAKEAGNSESEAAKSYDDSKTPAEAFAWFGLRPDGKESKELKAV